MRRWICGSQLTATKSRTAAWIKTANFMECIQISYRSAYQTRQLAQLSITIVWLSYQLIVSHHWFKPISAVRCPFNRRLMMTTPKQGKDIPSPASCRYCLLEMEPPLANSLGKRSFETLCPWKQKCSAGRTVRQCPRWARNEDVQRVWLIPWAGVYARLTGFWLTSTMTPFNFSRQCFLFLFTSPFSFAAMTQLKIPRIRRVTLQPRIRIPNWSYGQNVLETPICSRQRSNCWPHFWSKGSTLVSVLPNVFLASAWGSNHKEW